MHRRIAGRPYLTTAAHKCADYQSRRLLDNNKIIFAAIVESKVCAELIRLEKIVMGRRLHPSTTYLFLPKCPFGLIPEWFRQVRKHCAFAGLNEGCHWHARNKLNVAEARNI